MSTSPQAKVNIIIRGRSTKDTIYKIIFLVTMALFTIIESVLNSFLMKVIFKRMVKYKHKRARKKGRESLYPSKIHTEEYLNRRNIMR